MKLARSCADRATFEAVKPSSSKRGRLATGLAAFALALALACAPLAGCASSSSATSSSASQSTTAVSSQAQSKIKVTVNVKGEYEDVAIDETSALELEDGANALDALESTGLNVDVSDSSYGAYVTSIGDLAASGSNGWTYSVNGEMPSVSADDYELEDGDTIDWAYYVEQEKAE